METLVFLCNGEDKFTSEYGDINNSQLPALMKRKISTGEHYIIDGWSCWNSKFIKVGDRAYLQRSGSEPTGFIAGGYVIAAPEDKQLRFLNSKEYSNLSPAYVLDDGGCFYIYIAVDSVVDFDFPLEQKNLAKRLEFQGVNFNFGRSGARFNAKASAALDSQWEIHSLIQQRQGRGCRLVDVFCKRGEEYKQKKEYQFAIDAYRLALGIDPNYSKAKNRIKNCESVLQKDYPLQPEKASLVEDHDKSIDVIGLLSVVNTGLEREGFFVPPSKDEAKSRILVSIARRRGQTKFRQILLEAYNYKCAITDFDAEAALEAAHIVPYTETGNNNPSNGLLLRADLHTLFDLNLIAIHPETLKISLHPNLQETEYQKIHNKTIRVPHNEVLRPSYQSLTERLKQYDWL